MPPALAPKLWPTADPAPAPGVNHPTAQSSNSTTSPQYNQSPTHQAQIEAVIDDDVSREVCGVDANGFQEDRAPHIAGSGVALQLQQQRRQQRQQGWRQAWRLR